MKKIWLLVVVIVCVNISTSAQTGMLDQGFGNGGKVVTPNPFPLMNSHGMSAYDVQVQPDGKIVIAAGATSMADSSSFMVLRYNSDGTPDNTFGTGGKVITKVNARNNASALAIAIQLDGKIIAGGYAYNGYVFPGSSIEDRYGVLVRFGNNGMIDTSFGSNGIVTIGDSMRTRHVINAVLVKPNGKILAAGDNKDASGSGGFSWVYQFTASGNADSSYSSPYTSIAIKDLALQGDGKILGGSEYFSVIRWKPGNGNIGNLDSAFNPGGGFYTGQGWIDFPIDSSGAAAMCADANGVVTQAGYVTIGTKTYVALGRLNANGLADSTFGMAGRVVTAISTGNDKATGIHLQSDGKLLVTGTANFSGSATTTNGDFVVLRYNSNGTLDSSFGRHGVSTIDFAGEEDDVLASALQPDGKVVMAGRIYDGAKFNIALARLEKSYEGKYNTIFGSIFLDRNFNGIKDVSEPYFDRANISVAGHGNTILLNTSNGVFSADVDSGLYVTAVTPYSANYTVIPSSHTSMFNTYFTIDSITFAVQPIPGLRDLSLSLIPLSVLRPGFPASYKLLYGNNGTDTVINGTVELIKSSKLTFNGSTPAVTSISGDTLRWNIASLTPSDGGSIMINVTVQAPPVVNSGDTLRSAARVYSSTADVRPNDNTDSIVQVARGSIDPNDKTEAHGGKITTTQVANGDYLTYTIRFQNTGNDTAFNIYIHDTLDSKLDWNTFEMLTASDDYQMTLKDGKCVWTFSNINLVDSNQNEPASHGYVVYRIRPKSTVHVGDVITNSAAIYFDYNLPVNTNIDNTIVVSDVLPLKLLTFTAKRDDKVNKLNWSTSNEVNVERFEVERSANGREYSLMENGKLRMENGKHEYSYIDYSPLAIHSNYYRLKMIDRDGRFEYSPVRVVNNSGSFTVSVYPNPAKDKLQVNVVSEKKATLQVQVVSQDGKVLLTQQWNVGEDGVVKTMNTSSLQPGSYFIRITSADKEQSVVKFEKQ